MLNRCSEKYYDSQYEYRHVVLPPEVAQHLPKGRLLSEPEWRALGVQQSRGCGIARSHRACGRELTHDYTSPTPQLSST